MPFANDNIGLDKTSIDTLVDYGKQLSSGTGQPVTGEPIHYAVIPNSEGGFKLQSLLEFQHPHGLPPQHIKATPKLQDGKSFCDYIDVFKDERLCMFADASTSTLHAVLDYHTADTPDFCHHGVIWRMTYSPQWDIWKGHNITPMNQQDFVEFLEDNFRDIQEPSHGVLQEIIRDLKIHSEVTFESKVNIKNGANEFVYSEDMKNTGKMDMPDEFTIKVPVYFGEAPVEVNCRFRYRIPQGKLSVWYKLYRPVEVQLEAFRAAVAAVEGTLGVKVHLGTGL